jgi:hypothetical protein
MSQKPYEVGDVSVKRLLISSSKSVGASIVPLDQMLSLDIWEDMTKPTMYATLTLLDTLGILEKFPIIGEETVEIEFQTPGLATPAKYKFRCFEVSNMQRLANGKGMSYTLRCVSEEHLRNSGMMVRESMTEIIGNMVPYILQKHLQTTKPMIVDQTKGIQTIVFPRISPLRAIDMLRLRAVSKDYTSSAYVFFENQAGFNFKTVEGLYKDGLASVGSRVFNMNQNAMAEGQAIADSFRTLQSHQVIHRADSMRKLTQGAFRSVTRIFDVATKSYETVNYDFETAFSSFETAAKKTLSNTTEWLDEYSKGVRKQFFGIKDTSRPDVFITNTIGVRNSFVELLNDDITRILIHGDSGLKAGDVIRLNIPQVDGLTTRKTADAFMSSNYLITRLRHMISFNVKTTHEIVLDCVKMGT